MLLLWMLLLTFTDDGSLRRLFRSLEGKLSTGKRPSIFPWKVCVLKCRR